jgi:hypothetical protein
VNGILGAWDALVEIVGMFVVVIIGVGLMMGMIEPGRAFTRLGGVAGCMVLLIELPAILVGIWHSLSFWQHSGMIALALIVAIIVLRGAVHGKENRSRR